MALVNLLKDVINRLTAPEIFISLAAVLFFFLLSNRGKAFWKPRVALA
ncbi:hypothetical protein HY251_19310, partial [bacterium]|nr:hypothetical protein [bacterium]